MKAYLLLALLLLALPLAALPKAASIGLSAILPGTGEIIEGKTIRGSLLLGEDLIALTGYWATGRQRNDLISSYQLYARTYAGIPDNMDDNYYQYIQQYISSEEFNRYLELDARNYYLIYSYDPEGYASYITANAITDDQAWSWQNPGYQDHYRTLRRDAQKAKMNQNLCLGIIILNRVISVIDVALISRDHNKETSLYFSPLNNNGLMLNYSLEFQSP
jgi:hypothetical protein